MKKPVQVTSKKNKATPQVPVAVFYRKPGFLSLVIVLITFISFIPSLNNGFVNTWDDNSYVTENPQVTHWGPNSLKEVFSQPVNGTYVPLPLLSFAFEYSLFGNNPLPFHITNLVLHILCTLLVFYFLRLLGLDILYAAIGALLAGIHPMRVESVAWVTERKDLLYGLFYLGSMIFYVKSFRMEHRRLLFLCLSFLCFLLSLFSKIQAVALPLSLLLLDYFYERPVKFRLILEKVPFFLLSLLFGIAGIFLLQQQGILRSHELASFGSRILFAFYSLCLYLVKFFVPFGLSALYPDPVPPGAPLPALLWLPPFLILALVVLIFLKLRNNRVVIFGMLFFFLNILFLLQIVAAGSAFLADRFTYIPFVGLFFIAAWVMEKIAGRSVQYSQVVMALVFLAVIFLGAGTIKRCKAWKNDGTLWTDVIEKYPGKLPLSYTSRGDFYMKEGMNEKAMADFNTSIRLSSVQPVPYLRRALLFLGMSYYDSAIADYRKALSLDEKNVTAYQNLSAACFFMKDYDAGINAATKGLSYDPENANLYGNLGYCFLEKDRYDKAEENFQKCLKLNPANVDALIGLSMAFYNKNEKQSALKTLQRAQEIEPSLKDGMKGLAELAKTGTTYTEKERAILQRMFAEFK